MKRRAVSDGDRRGLAHWGRLGDSMRSKAPSDLERKGRMSRLSDVIERGGYMRGCWLCKWNGFSLQLATFNVRRGCDKSRVVGALATLVCLLGW